MRCLTCSVKWLFNLHTMFILNKTLIWLNESYIDLGLVNLSVDSDVLYLSRPVYLRLKKQFPIEQQPKLRTERQLWCSAHSHENFIILIWQYGQIFISLTVPHFFLFDIHIVSSTTKRNFLPWIFHNLVFIMGADLVRK